MKGLGQTEQEEFAASFADTFAGAAIAAGEFAVARQVYQTLLERFGESPNLRAEGPGRAEPARQGRQAGPGVRGRGPHGKPVRLESLQGQVRPGRLLGDLVRPCVAELPRLQAAYASTTTRASRSSASAWTRRKTAVVDFVKARKLPWRQVHNATGGGDLVEAFGVSSIPATYLDRSRGHHHPPRSAGQGPRRDTRPVDQAAHGHDRAHRRRAGPAARTDHGSGLGRQRRRPGCSVVAPDRSPGCVLRRPSRSPSRPSPNWSPARTAGRPRKSISTIFSLWTAPPVLVGQVGDDLAGRRRRSRRRSTGRRSGRRG